jgi:poly(3-hydroxybutyrate) depolymerase
MHPPQPRFGAGSCALVLATTLLAACGGSGESDDPGTPAIAQLSPASPASFGGDCTGLAAALSGMADTTITSAAAVAAGTLRAGAEPIAEHCRVTGSMRERVSPVDGRTYAIDFEMRLPRTWNGRFFHQGNGGTDGVVVTATGSLGGGPRTNALHQGFAVLSSNAGNRDAGATAFGLDPQARLDYGYQAVGTLTPMARELIRRVYGKQPDRSYFGGCSNGGRHAMVAASRYAQWYDGILAGAPAFTLPLSSIAQLWGAQRYLTVATDPNNLATAFTVPERRLVAQAILDRCDALDGLADGLVQSTAACQAAFNLDRDVPTCVGDRDGSCLTSAQKGVVGSIFRGAVTADGRRVYSTFPFDPGLTSANWALWEFTLPVARSAGSVSMIVKAPPEQPAGFDARSFTLNTPLETLYEFAFSTSLRYPVPAMTFMTPPNPTELGDLRKRGGKVMVFHGAADAVFSVDTSTNWFTALNAAHGGTAASFARVFSVPGMAHCSGGPATDQFDMLTPLVQWVERGVAPDSVVAFARGAGNPGGVNAEVPATWGANRSRPLCPFPQVARYRNAGNVEEAASFVCE